MSLARRNCGSGHTYTLDGKRIPGVTTIIKNGYPAPGLIGWTGKVVAEWVADADEQEIAAMRALGRDRMIAALRALPYADRGKAAERGRLVHDLAERLSLDQEIDYADIGEDLHGHADATLAFLDQWHPRPVLTEAVVGNTWVPYAGTLDMVADVPGHGRILLDYKTTDSGIWPETVLQLAAYRYADVVLTADGTELPMAELGIEHTWAVWIRSDGYDVIPLDTGPDRDTSEAFRTFRGAAYVAARVEAMRELIGPALPAPAAQQVTA